MSRVKRGHVRRRRHRATIRSAAGFRGKTSTWRVANQRLMKARTAAYVGRKQKKRLYRRLWITRLNGALSRPHVDPPTRYASFQNRCDRAHVRLNRKTLSQLCLADDHGFTTYVANLH